MTAATTNIRMQALQLAQDLDPQLLTAQQSLHVVEDLAVAEKAIATSLIFAAVRVASTELWRGHGHQTAADWLAAQLGITVREAKAMLQTGKRAENHPKTKAAMKKGTVSPSQAGTITDAADDDPDVEDDLLGTAEHDTTAKLEEKAAAAKAAATDEHQKAARARRGRYRSSRLNPDGTFDLHLHGPAADLAKIEAQLRPWDEKIFNEGTLNPDGSRDTFANRAYDGLIAFLTHQHNGLDPRPSASGDDVADGPAPIKLPGGNNVKVIIRIDWEALMRGHTIAGETCDIPGLGPLPVSAVKDLMDDAFLAAIVTKGRDVHTVAHLGRGLSVHQRTAIEWTGTACSNIACNRTITDMDHRIPWNQHQQTHLHNIDPLCDHDHHLKTHHGWTLEPGTGRRRFLPPGRDGDPPPEDPTADEHPDDLAWEQPTLC